MWSLIQTMPLWMRRGDPAAHDPLSAVQIDAPSPNGESFGEPDRLVLVVDR